MKNPVKLTCGCEFHQLEVDEFIIKDERGSFISICLYQHKSLNTGKLYKKPKLLADVMLHPEEAIKLKEYLNCQK
jgi:hypothetical protein